MLRENARAKKKIEKKGRKREFFFNLFHHIKILFERIIRKLLFSKRYPRARARTRCCYTFKRQYFFDFQTVIITSRVARYVV